VLRTLLILGLIAGLSGGIVASGFAKVVGEPPLDRAIAWESAHARGAGAASHDEVVSRTVQGSIGLFTGACVYGVSLGGLFALVFAGAYGRLSRSGPARTAIGLGAGALVVLYVVPFLKYPANPPSVGDPATIGERTWLYFGMMAISLLAAVAAVRLRLQLLARLSADIATVAAVAAFLVVVTVAGLVMPTVDEVPATFPATTLWDFRVASLGVQFAMYATIALVFGVAAERKITGAGVRREVVDPGVVTAPRR
jgi:Probable cobalt transporter subunit (CbtA)